MEEELFDGRYEKEKLLGQGAFSEVWKAKDIQTGVALALKIYNPMTGADEDGNEMLTHEFALMVNANHKNLLRPLFYASCDGHPYLILPFCERGNIGNQVGRMTEDEAWKLLRDTASALAFLHAMNPPILHQDIKPANILLSDNGDYMLTDFGVSTQARQSLSRVSNQEATLLSAGTISYMAPERFSRNNLPIMANDIYSLGSTVFEMLSGDLPFGNDGGLLQKKGADIPELPGDFSPMLKKVLDLCLQEEPWKRPTAAQLEEIANNAIHFPESRNTVPDENFIQQESAPRPSQVNVAGTIIGSSLNNNINSRVNNSVASSMNYNQEPPKKSKTPIYIGIAAVVVAAIIGAVVFLTGGASEPKEQPVALNTDSLMKAQEQADFEEALELFNQQDSESIQKAFTKMKTLALNGHKEAIFQMAYTFAWIPNDTESDRRKRLLGWEIIQSGDLQGQPVSKENNLEAIKWLDSSISATDSADYKSLYWLSFYYLNGLAVNQDLTKAMQLLEKAQTESGKGNDYVFKNKVDNTLNQLKQLISK